MSIGQQIKDRRKELKLTQKQLAEKANISRSYLADIENDRYNASVDTLKAISNSLDINVGHLIDSTPNLTLKEQESIDYKAKEILDEMSLSFSKNKEILTEEDYFALGNALRTTLEAIKIKNKTKFNPRKK